MEIESDRIFIEKKVFSDREFEDFLTRYLDFILLEERTFGSVLVIQIIDEKKRIEIIKYLYALSCYKQELLH